jgi:hypothetical protein
MKIVLDAVKSLLGTITGLTTTPFTLFTFPDDKYVGVRISFEGDAPTYTLKRSLGDVLPKMVLVFTARQLSVDSATNILYLIKQQLESRTQVTQGTVRFNVFTAQGSVNPVGMDEGLYVASLRVGVQYAV